MKEFLEKLDEQRSRYEIELKCNHFGFEHDACDLILNLIQIIRVQSKALQFYANHESWQTTTATSIFDGMDCNDFQVVKSNWSAPYEVAGKRANEALQESARLLK